MNGKAFPGGVDGRTHRGIGGALLTLEPTNRGDRTVHMWTHVAGEERSGMSLIPREVRGLVADLARRLAVIEPPDSAAAGAPSVVEPAAADLVPLPGPPPPPAALAVVLADMRDHAALLGGRQPGDEDAARIRGWVEILSRDEQWTRRLVAAALEVSAAVAARRTLVEVAGPRLSAALRDLDVALVGGPLPDPGYELARVRGAVTALADELDGQLPAGFRSETAARLRETVSPPIDRTAAPS